MDTEEVYRGLITLLCIRFPQASAYHIYKHWYLSVVTREYEQPSYGELQLWMREARA